MALMKIALVTTDFLPNIGGVAQHVFEIARALQEGGDEVEIITVDLTSRWDHLRKPPQKEKVDGLPVWRIPFVVNRSIKFISGQVSSRVSSQVFQNELLKRLEHLRSDVVHWHALNTTNNPMSQWRSSARVWTNHTSHFIDSLRLKGASHYEKQAKQADEIIAPSEELCELTASLGINRERIHFVPNGVDCARFRPNAQTAPWPERLKVDKDELVVLCPRRLEKKNGVSYFVRAAILLLQQASINATFVISGDFAGPRSESEESLVEKLIGESDYEKSFRLLGRVENRDMPGLYACSDLVVIPSLMEATSLSALEAMAAGKPIVATNVGGLPFLIREGHNGVLVPPCRPAELAQAMKRLLDSPNLRTQLGRNGRARVETEFDWRVIARRTKEVYRTAIERYSISQKTLATILP